MYSSTPNYFLKRCSRLALIHLFLKYVFHYARVKILSLITFSLITFSTSVYGGIYISSMVLVGGDGIDEVKAGIQFQGNIALGGFTTSTDFPIIDGNAERRGGSDGFLTVLNSDGSIVFSTLIGGSSFDSVVEIATIGTDLVVIGSTQSTDFPADGLYSGSGDIFIQRYSGSFLDWSILVGGAGSDVITSVEVDTGDNILLAGYTTSNFTSGGVLVEPDILLVKISSEGKVLWIEQNGGEGSENAIGIDSASNGEIYVTGFTESASLGGNFTTGGQDIFLQRFSPNGDLQSTALFGSEGDERGRGVVIGDDNSIYIAGYSDSLSIEGSTHLNKGMADLLVIKVDRFMVIQSVLYEGSSKVDHACGLTFVDEDLVVLGGSSSQDFPHISSQDDTFGGQWDSMILTMNTSLDVQSSRYVGGEGIDLSSSIFPYKEGYGIVGYTTSSDFAGRELSNSNSESYFIFFSDDHVTSKSITVSTSQDLQGSTSLTETSYSTREPIRILSLVPTLGIIFFSAFSRRRRD